MDEIDKKEKIKYETMDLSKNDQIKWDWETFIENSKPKKY